MILGTTTSSSWPGPCTACHNLWLPAGDVDIQAPNVEEARLLQSPVGATQKRLAELLEEWPEHPVLMQLDAICCRLQGKRGDAWVNLALSMTCMLSCLVSRRGVRLLQSCCARHCQGCPRFCPFWCLRHQAGSHHQDKMM